MADTDNTPLSLNELNAKVQEYHKFKETVLLRDLKVLETKRVQLADDLKELTQLEENVAELVKSGTKDFESRVDLGCEVICKARVPDTSCIYVNVGLGFHVECGLGEVPSTLGPRKAYLRKQIAETDSKLEQVQHVIDVAESSLEELQRLH